MRRFIPILILLLVSCGGDDSPSSPGTTESLANFELLFSGTVVDGEPFDVAVIAVGSDGSNPFVGFDGDVEFAVTSGSITPALVTLADGRGSARMTLSGATGNVQVSMSGQRVTSSVAVSVGVAASNGTIEYSSGSYIVDVQLGAGLVSKNPRTGGDLETAPTFGADHADEVFELDGVDQATGTAEAAMAGSLVIQEENGFLQLIASGSSECFVSKNNTNQGVSASGNNGIVLEFFVHGEPLKFELTGSVTAESTGHAGNLANFVLGRLGPTSAGVVSFRNEAFTSAGTLEPGQYRLSLSSFAFSSMAPAGQATAAAAFSFDLRISR